MPSQVRAGELSSMTPLRGADLDGDGSAWSTSKSCSTITQAPAPSRPIDRSMASAGLNAHVLVSKYCDRTPVYRLCQIYICVGVDLQRSTLADCVAQAARLPSPLAEANGRYVLAADKVHGDDTPIRVLGGAGNAAWRPSQRPKVSVLRW
ncbi:transposase [Variovorax sp. RCC_210]|uniref:IS66 family transposase n=1 Tax=Variovorax sp. RCC_210 TaxID=3239217 RepID=UPI003523697A